MKRPYIVGITGGSASGKTYFVNELVNRFNPDSVCLLSQDNYYKPKEQQQADPNGVVNFDLPTCIDYGKMGVDLEKLMRGERIVQLEYTFNNPQATPRSLTLNPAPLIIVEGIFVFYFEAISKNFDLKLFVDATEHVKLKRRIVRDNQERGYDLDDVLYRYTEHVAPTFSKYIEPFKYESDFIVPNNHDVAKALDVISLFLKSKL